MLADSSDPPDRPEQPAGQGTAPSAGKRAGGHPGAQPAGTPPPTGSPDPASSPDAQAPPAAGAGGQPGAPSEPSAPAASSEGAGSPTVTADGRELKAAPGQQQLISGLLNHPLIRSLVDESARNKLRRTVPSYIPSTTFAVALLDT